jgi:hypothetical protein
MRYITLYDTLELFSKGNGTKYRFGPFGILDLGSGVTVEVASSTDSDWDLQELYATDLNGATTNSVELCGQGSLNKKDSAGGTSLALRDGYRGIFFPAPVITVATSEASIPEVAGIYYIVLTGSVTYNGTLYTKGQTFVTAGSVDEFTSTDGGTIALWFPPELLKAADRQDLYRFIIGHLNDGSEVTGAYNNVTGYTGRAGIDSSVTADYFGHL